MSVKVSSVLALFSAKKQKTEEFIFKTTEANSVADKPRPSVLESVKVSIIVSAISSTLSLRCVSEKFRTKSFTF